MGKKSCVAKCCRTSLVGMYREYLCGLQEQSCKSLGRGAVVIKVDHVVVIGENVVPRHRWRLGIVVELIKSNDGLVRGAKVKVGKTRTETLFDVQLIVCIQLRYAAEQLRCNRRNGMKTKKKDVIRLKLRVQKEMLQLQEDCDDD